MSNPNMMTLSDLATTIRILRESVRESKSSTDIETRQQAEGYQRMAEHLTRVALKLVRG